MVFKDPHGLASIQKARRRPCNQTGPDLPHPHPWLASRLFAAKMALDLLGVGISSLEEVEEGPAPLGLKSMQPRVSRPEICLNHAKVDPIFISPSFFIGGWGPLQK